MNQERRQHSPSNREEVTTKPEIPTKKESSQENRAKLLKLVRALFRSKEIKKLETVLKQRIGKAKTEVFDIQESVRSGLPSFRYSFSSSLERPFPDEILKKLERHVGNGAFQEAYELLKTYEQYLLDTWIDEYLHSGSYQEAYDFLIRLKPTGEVSPDEHAMDLDVSEEILSNLQTLDTDTNPGEHNLDSLRIEEEHHRVWSAVHKGAYHQAAGICAALQMRVHGKSIVQAPISAEVQKRHERDLAASLPQNIEELAAAFPTLPQLLGRFQQLAIVQSKDKASLQSLKKEYQLLADKLFSQKRIVVHGNEYITAEDDLIGVIHDLKLLGFHLYIRNDIVENELYVLSEDEASKLPIFSPVELGNLSAKDLVIDEHNFKELPGPTTNTIPAGHVWVSKAVTIKSAKADELRRAA